MSTRGNFCMSRQQLVRVSLRFLDTNGNGAVSPEEFARGLQRQGARGDQSSQQSPGFPWPPKTSKSWARLGVHKLTGEELNEIMQTLDTDRSGDISLSEPLAAQVLRCYSRSPSQPTVHVFFLGTREGTYCRWVSNSP